MYQVSVIIPIYKVEKCIERCARSLFEQTLSSIEFIFVNDYSPDNSVSILQSVLNQYPNRSPHTKIVHHEYNRGLAAARNTGRSIAQGEYIIACDSDDWVERNMYELMYQKAKKTNADIVICDWNEIYATTTKYVSVNPPDNYTDCVIALLSGKMHGSVWNKLVRSSLYQENDIMCKEGMDFCEDFYVTYRLFYFAKSIAYINLPLYHYNKMNINAYTSNLFSIKTQQGLVLLAKEIDTFFQNNEVNERLNIYIDYFLNSLKSSLLLNGDYKFAKQIRSTTKVSILFHPTLPIHHKMVLLCCRINFIGGVKIIRSMYNLLKRFSHNILSNKS